jgi:hypothetical protein
VIVLVFNFLIFYSGWGVNGVLLVQLDDIAPWSLPAAKGVSMCSAQIMHYAHDPYGVNGFNAEHIL